MELPPSRPPGIRDSRGKFLPGNPGSPGRKPRATGMAYLEVSLGAVSEDDWRAVTAKALEQAKAGDDKARTFLAKLFGLLKPDAGPAVEAQGGESLGPLLAKPGAAQAVADLLDRLWASDATASTANASATSEGDRG